MAKDKTTTPVDNEQKPTYEELMEQLESAKATVQELEDLAAEQNKVIDAQSDVLHKLTDASKATVPKLKTAEEVNARMKEEIEYFYPSSALDPEKTEVEVLNPITNRVDQVKKDEWVRVTRAVAEILDHSVKSNKAVGALQRELADEYKAEEEAQNK